MSYVVRIHRRVGKFIKKLADEKVRARLLDVIESLEHYPAVLRRLDVEKIRGMERAFRIRVGRYRIVFCVDKKERVIYVTNIFIK